MTEQEERDRIAKDICKIRDITTKWKIYLDIADYVIHERQEAKKEGAREAAEELVYLLATTNPECALATTIYRGSQLIAENQPEVENASKA